MKKIVKITKKELIEMLQNWSYGAQPVSIQYVTSPKLNKDGKKILGDVIKIANVGGMIGYSYESSVNRELEREGKSPDFQSRPLWNGKGKRISSALSVHMEKSTYYLSYKYQQSFRSFYLKESTLEPLTKEQVKPFLASSTPKNQGVDEGKEILHRELLIDNIKKLKMKGLTYEIVG